MQAETTFSSLALIFWGLLFLFILLTSQRRRFDDRDWYRGRRHRRKNDFFDDYPSRYDDDYHDHDHNSYYRGYRRPSTSGCLPLLAFVAIAVFYLILRDNVARSDTGNQELREHQSNNNRETEIRPDTVHEAISKSQPVPIYISDTEEENKPRRKDEPFTGELHWTVVEEPEDRIIQVGVYSVYQGAIDHAHRLRAEKDLGDYVKIGLRESGVENQYVVFVGIVGLTHALQIKRAYSVKGFIKIWDDEEIKLLAN